MPPFSPSLQAYWKKMNQLLQTLNQKLATLNHGQEGMVKINAAVSDKVVSFKSKPPSIQREMLSVCSDPYTLAQQLTHVELERLSHIGPEEFVQAFVHKDPLESTKACHLFLSPAACEAYIGLLLSTADENDSRKQDGGLKSAAGSDKKETGALGRKKRMTARADNVPTQASPQNPGDTKVIYFANQNLVSVSLYVFVFQPCFSEQKKTSNLEAYVKWFNRLCYLVATEICMPAKKKQRAQVIEFFIDVARECFNIGNFNSLMAIISGMNMSPVSRLKKTWSKVKTAKFFILEHQMDPTGNFYNYRTALRGAAHRSLTAHSNREKIVIPFFSLLIKDIYFLNEGCANRLPNGHVNFEKFLELAKQVGEFITWKQVECPFERDDNIIHYLHTAPIFTEDGLYLASYESESPENQTEKERWKTLRY
ncbi:hypothetical protein JD844_012209 [Phrynosoma platyrhinos]|uniref:Ras-GEF domain-containing protein n=1 Tax=Phrynosoma platyrhinos TaxID=52577 RepID=A0ABQ7TKA9_PHRPL|nr:hypothetical protein JD844_012209 [Phrynosoma platyrhinos]